jgi:glutamyl-tRNA synthetase
MYQAFGWQPPAFCHLPMVMGEDGRKLSKRHGATSVNEFRKGGYLPEALINYVGMLGASYEDGRDLYPLADMERLFSIEHLKKAPAVFDYKRLEWFNGQYIRQKPDAELAALVLPWLEEAGLAMPGDAAFEAAVLAAMPLVKERLHLLADAPEVMGFLFVEPPPPALEEYFPKKFDAAMTRSALAEARALLVARFPATDEELEEAYRSRAAELGLRLGDLLMPLRVAVTGSRASPPLFGSIRLLGLEKSLARIDRSLGALGA